MKGERETKDKRSETERDSDRARSRDTKGQIRLSVARRVGAPEARSERSGWPHLASQHSSLAILERPLNLVRGSLMQRTTEAVNVMTRAGNADILTKVQATGERQAGRWRYVL